MSEYEEIALTDARIVEIRDEFLPSQGESFDCIAFARAIEAEAVAQERERCARKCEQQAISDVSNGRLQAKSVLTRAAAAIRKGP